MSLLDFFRRQRDPADRPYQPLAAPTVRIYGYEEEPKIGPVICKGCGRQDVEYDELEPCPDCGRAMHWDCEGKRHRCPKS